MEGGRALLLGTAGHSAEPHSGMVGFEERGGWAAQVPSFCLSSSFPSPLYGLPRAAVTRSATWVASSPRGQRAGSFGLWGSRLAPAPPGFWCLLSVLVPWLVGSPPDSASVWIGHSPCVQVCVQICPFYKDTSRIGSGPP